MPAVDSRKMDLESIDQYIRGPDRRPVELEATEGYLRRVRAQINLSKSRAANIVAYALVAGIVASLPLYVVAVCLMPAVSVDVLSVVFTKWYDVVAPLMGAVIGALFGMSIASRRRDMDDP
jgi:uncharacterized integral membrane protein